MKYSLCLCVLRDKIAPQHLKIIEKVSLCKMKMIKKGKLLSFINAYLVIFVNQY